MSDQHAVLAERRSPVESDPSYLTSASIHREIAALRELLLAKIDGNQEAINTRLAAMDRAQVVFQEDLTRVPTLTDRAVAGLRAEVLLMIQTIEQRLAGMDTAIGLVRQNATLTHQTLQTQIDNRPSEIDARIGHLEQLFEEKFHTVAEQFTGVQTQFSERDVRVRESALAATTAINAALQSQKEAAGESAKSFSLSVDKAERTTLEQINQQRSLLEAMKQGFDVQVNDIKDRVTRIESLAVGRTVEIGEHRAVATDSRGTIALAISAGVALFGVISFVLSQGRP